MVRPLRALTAALIASACARSPNPVAETTGPTQAADLERHRHVHRVLLVFGPSETDPSVRAQRDLWAEADAGFRDRDLVVLPVLASAGASDLPHMWNRPPGGFLVVLIGKDGHTAFRSEAPVTPHDLYERIDAMPMRRDEMRARGR